jgi:SAM-dependent methyltransferase
MSAPASVGELYDRELRGNAVFERYRRISLDMLAGAFREGDHVLDFGCGTGDEAVFLAGRGVRVLATDVLPGMVEATRTKAETAGLGGMVEAALLPPEGLGGLGGKAGKESFDGAYSSFGALNCLPDLGAFARDLHASLSDEAPFVCSVMGRPCLWELALYMGALRPREAFRRLGPVRAPVAGHMFDVRYYTTDDMERAFGSLFRIGSVRGFGLLPPPFAERAFRSLPRYLDMAARWDPGPLCGLGDHLFVEMRRVE